MGFRRQAIQVIRAAIVMIAVHFGFAVAQAHASHAHDSHAHDSHAHDKAAVAAMSMMDPEADTTPGSSAAIRHNAEVWEANQDSSCASVADDTCAGGHGGIGMACCGSALGSEPAGNCLPEPRLLRTGLLDPPHRSGINPQALRKPPRPFA